jgi:hypothetical protein
MPINKWPERERPREKLLSQGANVLSDAELLALFIHTGVRGKTALDISRDLLLQFGGLRCIVAASLEQFSKTLGLGLAKYVQIQAAKELATRCLQENIDNVTSDETGEHCKSNASRRAHDRRALTGEAGNASRRKVIVEATARSLEWASAWRTQDESGPTFSRVIRTNFGDRMAKIFRENSDSLVRKPTRCLSLFNA